MQGQQAEIHQVGQQYVQQQVPEKGQTDPEKAQEGNPVQEQSCPPSQQQMAKKHQPQAKQQGQPQHAWDTGRTHFPS